MKNLMKGISYIGLGLTAIPCFFVLTGKIDIDFYKQLMLIGTVIWMLTAPFWIFEKEGNA